MERVLLGVWDLSFLTSKSSGFELSGAGDDGTDDSAEAGVSSNIRRGIGRRICSDMLDVEETGVDCRGRIGCTKRCSRLPSCSLKKLAQTGASP
jgi:hypothetical protein